MASKRRAKDSPILAFIPLRGRTYLWNAPSNGRHAHFYELWVGETLRPGTFHRELHATLT